MGASCHRHSRHTCPRCPVSEVRVSVGAGAPTRRDLAFAVFLALVLSVGVLGVLLLNTAMQTQSDRIAAQQQRIDGRQEAAQGSQTSLDWASARARLAARAGGLHLQPVLRTTFVGLTGKRV